MPLLDGLIRKPGGLFLMSFVPTHAQWFRRLNFERSYLSPPFRPKFAHKMSGCVT